MTRIHFRKNKTEMMKSLHHYNSLPSQVWSKQAVMWICDTFKISWRRIRTMRMSSQVHNIRLQAQKRFKDINNEVLVECREKKEQLMLACLVAWVGEWNRQKRMVKRRKGVLMKFSMVLLWTIYLCCWTSGGQHLNKVMFFFFGFLIKKWRFYLHVW